MLEFRKNVENILRRVRKGERFVLSHRGRFAARLEPVSSAGAVDPEKDPFVTIGRRPPKPQRKDQTRGNRSYSLWRQLRCSWIPPAFWLFGTLPMSTTRRLSSFKLG